MSEKRYMKVQRRKSRLGRKKKRLRETRRQRRLIGRQMNLASAIIPNFVPHFSPPASLFLGIASVMAAQPGEAPDLKEQQILARMRANKIHGSEDLG